MKKSELLSPEEKQDRIKQIEIQKYSSVSLEDAAEAGFNNAYAWFEDMVINGGATVEMGKEAGGNESATIHIKPDIPKYAGKEYYTDDPEQITRLKKLAKGETIIVELAEDPDFEDS